MMSAFEVKNFRDLLMLLGLVLFVLAVAIGLPTAFTWITWNALVGDLFQGPYIAFVEAIPLALFGYVVLLLISRPEIKFEVHQTKSPEDKETLLRRFGSNSPEGKSQK